eukprot:365378-Chlamydomonas_euryale.AAC.12
MSQVYLAFSWHADLNGEAYKYTLMALHHKLTNLEAGFYHKRRSRNLSARWLTDSADNADNAARQWQGAAGVTAMARV